MNNPNSFDEEVQDALANPEDSTQGTETEAVDYKVKFTNSSQEALRLKAENDKIKKELEEIRQSQNFNNSSYSEELIPNFGELDEEAQNNLLAYTRNIERKVTESIYKDPALSFAKGIYNEKRWDEAFQSVSEIYPELKESSQDFKSRYFNANNVPDNISEILNDVAKIYLFDKVKEIGAEEERKKSNRVELEHTTGGERVTTARRTLADWQELAQTNPAKFASLSKEYEEDLKRL